MPGPGSSPALQKENTAASSLFLCRHFHQQGKLRAGRAAELRSALKPTRSPVSVFLVSPLKLEQMLHASCLSWSALETAPTLWSGLSEGQCGPSSSTGWTQCVFLD